MKILFTGIDRRVELIQAFREAASCNSIPLSIFGTDVTDTAPALAYCDFIRPICGMKEKEYINELLRICREDNIDLVIPTIDTDLLVLAENQEKFCAIGSRVLISSPDCVKICQDKILTSQFFVHCGLKTPFPVNDWAKYNEGYPAFIKPKNGSSSIHAYTVINKTELKVYSSQISDYMIQPFIRGNEYTIDIFTDWIGNPIFITPRIRLSTRGGEVLKTQIDLDKKIIQECEKLIKELKPCGPITVQLIRESGTNVDYFIEINPRFGGGAPLSMKAGARSAEAVLRLLSNKKMEYKEIRAEQGAVYSRFDQSVCVKRGRKSHIKGIIFDLDDTLYSEKAYVKSGFQAVAQFLGDLTISERLWHLFRQNQLAIDQCLDELKCRELKEECIRIYRSHHPKISLYDNVEKQIRNLRDNGIKIGIITDGRPEGQRNKIAALKLENLADDIIITDELGGEQFRKPCDIAFRIMATRWKLPYEQIVYVGDNYEKDFQAPQQLGMMYIWIKNKNGLYQINDGKNKSYFSCLDDLWNYLDFATKDV